MSNRLVRHSSRYNGPSGDSRPAAEIFAGIEAREVQTQECIDRLNLAMDDVLKNVTLSSFDARVAIVKGTAIEWLMKHDLEFAELAGRRKDNG